MTALPSQPLPVSSGSRTAFRAGWARSGCLAVYTPRDGGDGTVVKAVVMQAAQMPRTYEKIAAQQVSLARPVLVNVEGFQPDEAQVASTGVGSLGGVLCVKVGDTFKVPGWAAGRPEISAVTLRVSGGVYLMDGSVWHAEGVA